MSTFSEMFKEYMYIGALNESDQKLYFLISRYEYKVSKRLLKIQKDLLKEGEVQFGSLLKDMIKAPNILLSLIEKNKSWGNLYHQPVILGLEHGITFVTSED